MFAKKNAVLFELLKMNLSFSSANVMIYTVGYNTFKFEEKVNYYYYKALE